ncbi:actin-like protein ALP 5 [Besnoitia besnoiti]|uniref:Actin-like protein ALP 5 n=1 Tax=Besnoitia besnoiti TaxID=94643 RepID=A0A2A9M690_BESBE|nr:actin-like protein ALP 5 [Besnoitia besnoiti]PFH33469.1 actin-like protein ALP 5 [Besnoitia besnoiti]
MMVPPAVVLDNGTGCLKAGFAGEFLPRHCLNTCVGQVRERQHQGLLLYGEDLLLSSNYFCLRPSQAAATISPLVSDVEMMRDLWEVLLTHKRYLNFSEASLADQGVIVTEPFLAPPAVRHALSEVLFEDFRFSQVLFLPAQQAVPFAFLNGPLEDDDATEVGADGLPGLAGSVEPKAFAPDSVRRYGGLRAPPPPEGEGEGEGGDVPDAAKGRSRRGDREEEKRRRSAPASLEASQEALVFRGKLCGLVVDVGFSGSMVVPYMDLQPVERAALRSSVGGSLLTTVLKNLCGFRSLNLERNELLVQRMKEACCFVSQDFDKQLSRAQSEAQAAGGPTCVESAHLFKEFFLPEYGSGATRASILSFFNSPATPPNAPSAGAPHAREPVAASLPAADAALNSEERQSVRLCTERISVPEVLFHPQDVGSAECGLVELIQRSIALLPRELQPFAGDEILLVGGSSQFPGLRQRLWRELRAALPQHWPVNIYTEAEPQFSVWRGASCSYADRALFDYNAVTRQQFEEVGTHRSQGGAQNADYAAFY